MGLFDIFRKDRNEPEQPDIFAELCQYLPFPYTILPEHADAAEITQFWEHAYARGQAEGFTPVLVPEDAVLLETMQDSREEGFSVEEALKQANALDGKAILAERLRILTDPEPEWHCEPIDLHDPEFRGTLQKIDRPVRTTALPDVTDKGQRIAIFELPTKNAWEAALYIPFGGWNDCPNPEEIAAVLRYWQEMWGAVPMTITHDVLELHLPAPVPEACAWNVAEEYFAFTTDSIFQGTETLGALAGEVCSASVWFFWWD